MLATLSSLNPRPDGEGESTPLSAFGTTVHNLFRTCYENFRPRSLKVMSPVTSSDLTSEQVWILVIATPNDRSPWNFKPLISVTVSIKFISRDFDIGDPRSGQFCDLSIKSQWEKIERRFFCTKTIQNTLKHRVTGKLNTLNQNIATGDPSSCRRGRFRSCKVTSRFLAITFDSDKLDQWKHHRYRYVFRLTIHPQKEKEAQWNEISGVSSQIWPRSTVWRQV